MAFNPRHAGRSASIDVHFVRGEAEKAVRQFFRPITAAFEVTHDRSADTAKHLGSFERVDVPKPPRIEMRGYAMRKRER
jgi:hypothetical protein